LKKRYRHANKTLLSLDFLMILTGIIIILPTQKVDYLYETSWITGLGLVVSGMTAVVINLWFMHIKQMKIVKSVIIGYLASVMAKNFYNFILITFFNKDINTYSFLWLFLLTILLIFKSENGGWEKGGDGDGYK